MTRLRLKESSRVGPALPGRLSFVDGANVAPSREGGPAGGTWVPSAFSALDVKVENAEITMQPKQTVQVDEDRASAVLRLLEALEEDDDVQQVYANFDIPADVLERISANV